MHPSAPGWADKEEIWLDPQSDRTWNLNQSDRKDFPIAYHYERTVGDEVPVVIRQTVMYPGQHNAYSHPTGNEIVDPIPAPAGFPEGMVTEDLKIHTFGYAEPEGMEEYQIDDAVQHHLGIIAALLEARKIIGTLGR